MNLNKQKATATPTHAAGVALAAILVGLFAVPMSAGASCADTNTADLVITGARIVGAGPDTATIQISGNRICAIGHASDLTKAKITVDARGMAVLPGLIDSHGYRYGRIQKNHHGHKERPDHH